MISTAPQIGLLSALLRLLGTLGGAIAGAWALDWLCRSKGLLPPGFRYPGRRWVAFVLVTGIFWVGIFGPLGSIGHERKLDLSRISTPDLFLLHALMAAAVLGWFALGFAGIDRAGPLWFGLGFGDLGRAGPGTIGQGPSGDLGGLGGPLPGGPGGPPEGGLEPANPGGREPEGPGGREPEGPGGPERGGPTTGVAGGLGVQAPVRPGPGGPLPFGRQLVAQLGLAAADVPREVAIGLLLGVLAWAAVLIAVAIALAAWAVAGGQSLPKPSALVPWIAAQPVMVRVMLSLSAGFVEEIFFRGFLQPRVGIALSSACFVLAHVSYGQPFMLLAVLLLSLIYAWLVRWRQTIWPAIAAHALFDGIQLLVIIPAAMRLMGQPERAESFFALAASACGGIW